jgi:hypothetical protein
MYEFNEFDDFNENTIYIRKDVKSCSDFNKETENEFRRHNTSKETHYRLNAKDELMMQPDSQLSKHSSLRKLLNISSKSSEDGNGVNDGPFRDMYLENVRINSIRHQPPTSNLKIDGEFGTYSSSDNTEYPDLTEDRNNFPKDFSVVEEWNAEEDMFSSKTLSNHKSTTSFGTSAKKAHYSFAKFINNLFENPDGRMTNFQRASIILFSCFEVYRTIISSFLTVFVPQNCGGFSCTILQNIIPKDRLEMAAISVNTFMALYFCAVFSIERIRETIVKRLLISDKTFSTDKEFLITMLSEMKPRHQRRILGINRTYRAFAQVLLLLFFANAGISCIVIRKNYLNNTTVIVFITNTFFMINRIYKALKITSSGEYNIYSAYRSESLLYNRYRGKIAETNIP